MAVAADSVAPARERMGAGVVTLLGVMIFVSYVDRGNLATAAPLMKDELHLTAGQIGMLLSAFYISYIPSQILAGWLAERITAYRTLALAAVLWSLATAASGLVTSFALLIALRLALGISESAAFPCSSKLLARHLPGEQLGKANAAIAIGLALGPGFGTLAGGLLMAHYGWRAVFLLFGLASLLWLVPWQAATRDLRGHGEKQEQTAEPGFRELLGRRELWAASLGQISGNYVFYFVIYWLPLYLVKSRGFSVSEMAELAGIVYFVYAGSSQFTGWLSDRLMRNGMSANRVRKTGIIFSNCGTALAMLGCAFGNIEVCVASLIFAGISFGPGSVNLFAIAQTLAGPRAAGKWVGIQNCLGNIPGVVAPLVTGFLVDRTGNFFWPFAVSCAIALLGTLAWGVMIPRVAPLRWRSEQALSTT